MVANDHSSPMPLNLVNFFKHFFFVRFFAYPATVMGELNQLAILALVQVHTQKFVRVVAERYL